MSQSEGEVVIVKQAGRIASVEGDAAAAIAPCSILTGQISLSGRPGRETPIFRRSGTNRFGGTSSA